MTDNTQVVRSAIEKMLSQGATEQEVDEYVAAWGMTPEQVKMAGRSQFRQAVAASPLGPAVAIGEGLVEQARGPKTGTRDLPAFTGEGVDVSPLGGDHTTLAGAVTWDDEQYGKVIKKMLGDRLVGTERDPNGYEILTYRGDDGKEYVAYVNKPGLDLSDVNRELAAAIPMVAGGLGIGTGLRALGVPLLGRMLGIGTGEAALTAGQDVVGRALGAEPKIVDTMTRAIVAGGTAGVFEGLSAPLARAWRALIKQDGLSPTGQLTGATAEAARQAGLDPDQMNVRLSDMFQRELRRAADPSEVAAYTRTQEFDIPTTRGQRTKDPNLLALEQEAAKGLHGREAQDIIGRRSPSPSGFLGEQETAIDRAVNESVGMSLAPHRQTSGMQDLGQGIREGARASQGQWKEMEEQLWVGTNKLMPTPAGLDLLPEAIVKRLEASGVRPEGPAATEAMDLVTKFREGKLTHVPHKILGESKEAPPQASIRDVQKWLLDARMGAELGSPDSRAAGAIYDGFNDWIEDVAQRGAVAGDPEGAAKLWVSRAFTREMHDLFEPTLRGEKTEAAKILQGVLEREDTPEGVVRSLLGSGGPSSAPARGSVQALQHLRRILGDAGRGAWDDVRLAYWVKLTQNKEGATMTPRMLQKNIDMAFRNQKSVLDALYTPEEQGLMQRLARAMEDVHAEDLNPSGTSRELARQRQRGPNNMLSNYANWQRRKAQLNVDVLKFALWKKIAQWMPLQGTSSMASRTIGKGVTAPRPAKQTVGPALTAPLGTAVGLELYDEEILP